MKVLRFALIFSLTSAALLAQPAVSGRGYVLGPQDSITVRVVDLEEFDQKSLGVIRIDDRGNIRLPLAGRIQAGGLTVEQLEKEIVNRLSTVMKAPEVTVSIAEFRSHPVSVLGAVKSPGVYQITGRKTLFEVLSLAGGLTPEASNRIKITRVAAEGTLPLPDAVADRTGEFFIGELNVRDIMEAKNPEKNIDVLPNDVVSVPKAELVYVVGAVRKSGGFPLNEKEHISVLQAVSLAEGLERVSSASHARILRQSSAGGERTEIPVDVQKILDGRGKDVALQANDILFIPTSMAKSASLRALEAVVQAGTGIAIWGR